MGDWHRRIRLRARRTAGQKVSRREVRADSSSESGQSRGQSELGGAGPPSVGAGRRLAVRLISATNGPHWSGVAGGGDSIAPATRSFRLLPCLVERFIFAPGRWVVHDFADSATRL